MRSANPVTCAALTAAALLVGGCATTQQEAVRLRLNSSRLRAAEHPVSVTRTNPTIRVEHVTLLRGGDGSGAAVAVRIRNLARSATSDLPIAVRAETSSHHAVTLNGEGGLDYFETHLPSINAGGRLTWVFTTHRRLPAGVRVSAAVGPAGPGAPAVPAQLPGLQVTPSTTDRGSLRLTVRNPTSTPQYQLQVYALAGARGHIVAAGRGTIPHLGTHSSQTLTVHLLGAAPGGQLFFEAPPTIFG